MDFLTSELRNFKSIHKEEELDPQIVLGPAPDLIQFSHPVLAKVTADLIETEVLISGEATTTLSCICGRCLTRFSKTVGGSFKQSVEAAQDHIDVTYYIKEAIILDLPPNAICRESCQGLCPQCGTNRNEQKCSCAAKITSPQWDVLKNIRL